MIHYIAMGGEHGCLPDNCQAYETLDDAIEGLDCIYELSESQLENLRASMYTDLEREQGGAYCEISDCNCAEPWEHGEMDSPDNWPDYAPEPCDDDIIIGDEYVTDGKWRVKRPEEWTDLVALIEAHMDAEQFWPNVWLERERGGFDLILNLKEGTI